MKERKNLVMDSNGNITNWRENIEREYRYISQEVTIKRAELICQGPYLNFKIECFERIPIEIHLINSSEISKIREIYSLAGATSQEELKGKKMICYSGINGIVWAVGSIKEDWIVNIYDPFFPRNEEQMRKYQMQKPLSDKEWEDFCKKQSKLK